MDYESLFKAARKAGTALTDVEPERLGRILQHACKAPARAYARIARSQRPRHRGHARLVAPCSTACG